MCVCVCVNRQRVMYAFGFEYFNQFVSKSDSKNNYNDSEILKGGSPTLNLSRDSENLWNRLDLPDDCDAYPHSGRRSVTVFISSISVRNGWQRNVGSPRPV